MLVAPQIAPFTFGEEPVNAGEMVSVQCAVVKGDSPLEVTWMFNNHLIESDQSDIVIDNINRRKQLTIESISARHAGEYTCVASNIAGSVSRTAALDINGIFYNSCYCNDFLL